MISCRLCVFVVKWSIVGVFATIIEIQKPLFCETTCDAHDSQTTRSLINTNLIIVYQHT